MLSSVGASVQAALQAGTLSGKGVNRPADRPADAPGARRLRDTVTISPEAVQRTQAALNATDTSHHAPPEREQDDADRETVRAAPD